MAKDMSRMSPPLITNFGTFINVKQIISPTKLLSANHASSNKLPVTSKPLASSHSAVAFRAQSTSPSTPSPSPSQITFTTQLSRPQRSTPPSKTSPSANTTPIPQPQSKKNTTFPSHSTTLKHMARPNSSAS